jgi:GNAT superfamily N-acetyltransferase
VLRELAEYPNSFGPLGPGDERIETDRYTLCMSGGGLEWNTVQRQRFHAGEVDEVLAEVRAHLRERGRTKTQWEIGSKAQPPNLVELLLERGLIRDREPYATAMVLRREPAAPPPDVVARPVETFEEYRTANDVQRIAFESPDNASDDDLRRRWENSPNVTFAAWLDGKIVAAATSAPTPHGVILYGGATHPDARGRGAYRALVHARWRDAVERGTPILVTQAGRMSQPILARLGFEAVGWNHALLDEFDRTAS